MTNVRVLVILCLLFMYIYFFIKRVPKKVFCLKASGIWLFWRPGFGIFEEKGSEIRDCNFERDTGLGDFMKRDSGNVISKGRDPGSPLTKLYEIKLSSLRKSEIGQQNVSTVRPDHAFIVSY